MPIEMYTLGLPLERQTIVRVNDERPLCVFYKEVRNLSEATM